MINKVRKCANINCTNMIYGGRSNKIYCCDKCRSQSFQNDNFDTIYKERKVIKGIRENDKVLEKLFLRLKKSKDYPNCVELSHSTLTGAGYNESFCAYTEYSEIDNLRLFSYNQLNFKLIYHPTEKNHFLLCII